jgi:hypothetical protein
MIASRKPCTVYIQICVLLGASMPGSNEANRRFCPTGLPICWNNPLCPDRTSCILCLQSAPWLHRKPKANKFPIFIGMAPQTLQYLWPPDPLKSWTLIVHHLIKSTWRSTWSSMKTHMFRKNYKYIHMKFAEILWWLIILQIPYQFKSYRKPYQFPPN